MEIIYGLIGIAAGGVVAVVVQNVLLKNRKEQIIQDAEKEGENLKQNKILQAKETFLKLKEDHEQKIKERERKLQSTEDRVRSKEQGLSKKIEETSRKEKQVEKTQENLDHRLQAFDSKQQELDKMHQKMVVELSNVSGISAEDAKTALMDSLRDEARTSAMASINDIVEEAKLNANREAKRIVIQTIQRVATEQAIENSVSVFNIESDEVKGRIIGREGRNIRALEAATGVEIIVDDTPEAIILSCFDPVRREIARVALELLLSDGRLQPAKIEEVVEKARKEVGTIVRKMGEKAAYEALVPNLHPDLVKILGRLHFRTSYGQNVLWHSVEMAHIASIIAEEIGADPAVARAGALLHDIGKTVSQEVQGTHVEIGIRILQKYGVDERVILAMRAHHEEYPYETPEAIIVQVADAISGGRPGARRDSIENYIKRLAELEEIATAMPGVEKAFAIQAGREVRVIVSPEKVSDMEAYNLARSIATDIESKLRYPGEIKVNVIREMRAIEIAR